MGMPGHLGNSPAQISHGLDVGPRSVPTDRGLFAVSGAKTPLFSFPENRELCLCVLVNVRCAYFTTFSIKRIIIVATWALVALPWGSIQITPSILFPLMMPSATAQLTAFLA